MRFPKHESNFGCCSRASNGGDQTKEVHVGCVDSLSFREQRRFARRHRLFAGEVARRVLVTHEAGELITQCGWCLRVEIDSVWHLAPRIALGVIDQPYSVSHSICPACDLAPQVPTSQ